MLICAAWTALYVVERRVSAWVRAEASSAGVTLAWRDLAWTFRGDVVVEGLHIEANTAGAALTLGASRLETEVDLRALRQRRLVVRRIVAQHLTLDAHLLETARDEGQSEDQGVRQGRPRRRIELPERFEAETLDLRLRRQAGTQHLRLSGLYLRRGDEDQVEVSAELAETARLPLPLDDLSLEVPAGTRFTARGASSSLQPASLRLSVTCPAGQAAALVGGPGRFAIGALHLDGAQDLQLLHLGIGAQHQGMGLDLSIDALHVRARAPFSSLAQLSFERINATGLQANIHVLPQAVEPQPQGVAPDPLDPAQVADSAGAPTEASVEAAGPDRGSMIAWRPPGWEERPWWEVLPQFITLEDVRINHQDASGSAWNLALDEVRYGLRVLQGHLTLAWRGQLARADGGQVASGDADLQWNFRRGRLSGRIDLGRVDLREAWRVARGGDVEAPVEGVGRLALRLEEGPSQRVPSQIRLDAGFPNITLRTALLDEPLSLGPVSLRALLRGEPGPDDGPMALHVEEGVARLVDAQLGFALTLEGLTLGEALPFRRAIVRVDVPDQPAQVLVDAVPLSLRAPLGDLSLGGTFGMELAFNVALLEGPRGWAIRFERPFRTVIRDRDLRLVTIDRSRDPRRLNEPFSFLFLGPDERIRRTLHVPGFLSILDQPTPPPEVLQDDSAAALREGSWPWLRESWVRLDDISYYLIAMQLYREDGSFLHNNGINWLQLRTVIEEAVERREPGRGASTITMQLVKNVLLTHERSIERKLQELFLTYWLNRTVPKERVLEIYLNVIEWGPGINGIYEAARYYFNKHPRDLTLAESTWLSAITPAPARWSVHRERGAVPPGFWRRCQDLMRGLHRRGLLRDAELSEGLAAPPRFATATPTAPGVDDGLGGREGGVAPAGDQAFPWIAEQEGEAPRNHPRFGALLQRPPQQRLDWMLRVAADAAARRR